MELPPPETARLLDSGVEARQCPALPQLRNSEAVPRTPLTGHYSASSTFTAFAASSALSKPM